ncbi:MAG TPA: hypothetical protein VN277_01220 [Acidiferrobacterales bacterium]|nr:hypothetical protein [Acidiferrobacterales bacterium]
MNIAILVLVAASLGACATTEIDTNKAAPAASLDAAMTTPRQSAAQLIIKRDTGFAGSACGIVVSVDGRPLADLRPGEFAVAYLDAGDYVLRATPSGRRGGCVADPPLVREASVVLKNDGKRIYRIRMDENLLLKLEQAAR